MKKNFGKTLKYITAILDAWLPWKIKYDEVPGISVGVVHQGNLVYSTGFGFADPERKQKATSKTGYRIASISKVFTAVVLLQLVETGKLRLDDPLVKFLPWFKAKNKLTDGTRITIRQVLSHTAGLYRDGTDPHWADGKFPNSQELRAQQSRDTFSHENLTAFKYSNYGFALLGEVIAKVSGKPYGRYLHDHIFSPLRMHRTAADLDERSRASLAQGYEMKFPGKAPQRALHVATNAYAPAAGLVSNVPDLAKFISALMPHAARPIIARESIKEMSRGQWKVESSDTGAEAYGIGVMIAKSGNRKLLCHSGGFMGFVTNITWNPADEVGVIVLINSNDGNPSGIARGILEMIYYLVDHADDFSPSAKNLTKYRGTYRSQWGDVVVVPVGSKLVAFNPSLNFPAKSWMVCKPIGKDTFMMDGPEMFDHIGEKMQFEFEKGRVARLYWGPMPHERIL